MTAGVNTTGVVLVAAGSGTRLGAGQPKAFVALRGRPLIAHAIERILALPGLAHLVVVVPQGWDDPAHPRWRDILPAEPPCPVTLVEGGAQRGDSVWAGVSALSADIDVVLVHDAARCLAPTALFERVCQQVRAGHPAVVPGIPVVDTVKQVDAHGRVVGTPERAALRAIQTPQGFTRAVLERAHREQGSHASDDAGLVERLGLRVFVVAGDERAGKITTPGDLLLADALLAYPHSEKRSP